MKQVGRFVLALALPLSFVACKPQAGDLVPTASAATGRPSESTSGSGSDVKLAPLSFAPIAKKADPSVVTIYTVGQDPSRARLRGHAQQGLGSGFIVGKDGTLITNNHVIEGAGEITVQTSDERRFKGTVVGRDARTDIAVVRIQDPPKDLTAIPLGDSDALDVGDWVVAIGNPFGLSHTVSAGIVSGKGRGREDVPLDPSGYYSFIQTDASINPGNSGGPLLNLKGEVVGMNSAIRGGGAQGIGFAIPINMVKQLMPTLIANGHVTRSALGVAIRDVKDLASEERLKMGIKADRGALIERVEPGSPAERAKMVAGDVVVGFETTLIERGSLLQWMASTAGVGKVVTVKVDRSGKPMDLTVTLGELREPKRIARPRPIPENDEEEEE